MKLRLALVGAFVAVAGLVAPGVAAAHGPNHPTPDANAAARAEQGLLSACKGSGWTALYTPIQAPFTPPADNPQTQDVNENDADAFTFVSREQCKNVIRAGLPVGLLARHANGTDFITVPADTAFPQPPRGNVLQPAEITVENVVKNGTTGFSFVVKGVRFAAGEKVVLILNKGDGIPQVVRNVGPVAADGTFTFQVVGTCHESDRVTSLTAFQDASNRTDSANGPTVC